MNVTEGTTPYERHVAGTLSRQMIGSIVRVIVDGAVRVLGFVFLVLGVLKLLEACFPTHMARQYLVIKNPVFFFVPNLAVVGIAALAEMLVGCYASFSKSPLVWRAGAIAWFSGAATCYKLALAVIHYRGPCGCLLGINRILPLNLATQQSLAEAIIIVSLALSAGVLVVNWLRMLAKNTWARA